MLNSLIVSILAFALFFIGMVNGAEIISDTTGFLIFCILDIILVSVSGMEN